MLWLFDVATRRAIQELPHPRPVTAADYTADNTLLTLAAGGTIRTWHLPGPEITGATDTIFALSYDSSGRKLGVGPGVGDHTLTVWDTTEQQNPRAWPVHEDDPVRGQQDVVSIQVEVDQARAAGGGQSVPIEGE
jgi:WD40 repeat protein